MAPRSVSSFLPLGSLLVLMWQATPVQPGDEHRLTTEDLYVNISEDVRYYVTERYLDTKVSKPAVLMLPGIADGYLHLDIQVEDFSWMDYIARMGFVAYGLDFRGQGKSTKTSGMDVRTEILAYDVKLVVEEIKRRLDVDKVHLIGQMFGSEVAAVYAAIWPEDVDKLILTSIMFGDVGPFLKQRLKSMQDAIHQGIYYLPSPPLNLSESPLDPKALAWVNGVTGTTSRSAPIGLFMDLDPVVTNLYMSKITAPTLIIAPAKDEVAPVEMNRLAYESLGTQNKELVVIPNAAHNIHLETEGHKRLLEAFKTWLP